MPMTPEQVAVAAEARYPGGGYGTTEQRVFAWLVEAAAAAEAAQRATGTHPVHARLMLCNTLMHALDGGERRDPAARRRRRPARPAWQVPVLGRQRADLLQQLGRRGPFELTARDGLDDLVDIARTYEQLLTDLRARRSEQRDLGEAVGMSPRVTMVLALMENLDSDDES